MTTPRPRRDALGTNSCDQCGFLYGEVPTAAIAERLRTAPSSFRRAVSGVPPELARRRPRPEVWSAIEYVCHVRDVLLVQRDRAVLAQVEERPSFPRMHRDERVTLCHYGDQELEEVLGQLDMAASLCALVFDGMGDASLARRIVYDWPQPAEFDLAWLGRHTVHEVEHHLQDVRMGLTQQ